MNYKRVRELIEITFGVLLLVSGFYFFLLPTNLVIGGVMGISVLIKGLIPVSLFMYLANATLLLLSLIFLGKQSTLRALYASILSPTLIWILELTIPSNWIIEQMTESPLLMAAGFGGILIGLGLGLVIRNNATSGGMDVVQNIVHKYFKIPFTTAMYIIDGIILLIAIYINIQLGLYAIGSIILIGLIVDRLSLKGAFGYTIFIVTDHSQEIREAIFKNIDRGFTKIKVYGGYADQPHDMIICTIQRREFYYFKQIINEVDPKAFTFVTKTKEALGQGFSKEKLKWETKN